MRLIFKFIFFAILLKSFSSHAVEQNKYQKIATLAPHLTEWAYSLDLGEKIVAVSAYSDFPEHAKEHPIVSDVNGINLEKLIALQPDLVMLWKNSQILGQVDKLEALGIDIFISDPKTLEDIGSEILRLGKVTNKQILANKIVDQYLSDLTNLRKKFIKMPKRKAFFQIWHSPLITANGDTWIQNLMDVCQFENPFFQHEVPYPTVNKEQVLLHNPDIIIISEKSENSAQLSGWQSLSMINAVKNNKVFNIDPDHLHRFTRRVLFGIEALCEISQ
ncbi:cobalamin-binding protein [Pseudoalteromonas denitrificans]|uniref:Vitamin B12 transport system substrate-binding protein n=1 Tax=Pseudoalteromonas denitrificans DSM 6059 TaxID=1123010 RepID=A0A1I1PVX0_9GAMM|nr:cobalamin-binding protein [Pseudoalteromonas denitrificans]SFD11113.1 vitamin B12 transport system substrate-binding protein [Pseudoalteromonas denitrificans DSM 6059]